MSHHPCPHCRCLDCVLCSRACSVGCFVFRHKGHLVWHTVRLDQTTAHTNGRKCRFVCCWRDNVVAFVRWSVGVVCGWRLHWLAMGSFARLSTAPCLHPAFVFGDWLDLPVSSFFLRFGYLARYVVTDFHSGQTLHTVMSEGWRGLAANAAVGDHVAHWVGETLRHVHRLPLSCVATDSGQSVSQ